MARLAPTASEIALAARASAAAFPASAGSRDRRLSSRHPRAYLTWMFWGAVGTYVDSIHEAFKVVSYPNPDWVGEKLPVSPAYLVATTGFFALYTLIVGHRQGVAQGYLGGEPVRLRDIAYALGWWIGAYVVCGYLGAPARTNTFWPWLAALGLIFTATPTLWRERHTRLPLYVLCVAVLGVTFEWSATSRALFEYPVCPSRACLDATVPLVWLPFLYVHAALFMHRLLGGAHAMKRA